MKLFSHFRLLASSVVAGISLTVFSGCNDDNSSIGSSLVTDKSEISIDSAFTVSGHSVATHELRARTLTQLIGSIDARRFGTLRSDYVTQLMPSSEFDTAGVTPGTVDSLRLVLRFYSDKITGDSMTPMGVKIFALNRQLPSEMKSNFNPSGYYDADSPLASAVYSSNLLYSDSLERWGVHLIETSLPVSLGREYVERYRRDPSVFSSPEAFASIFPGIYVANSFGSGRVTNIFNTRVVLYYHSNTKYTNTLDQERDTTIYHSTIIAASTPEVLTNNNLSFSIDPMLVAMASSNPMLVAPLGYESMIKMPVEDIIASFKKATNTSMGVVNSLTMQIPCEEIENEYGIEPPAHVLLVPSSERDKFFAEQMIPDNETSFIADYDSATKSYYFSGLRPYLMHMMALDSGSAEFRNHAELSIVPVEVSYETYTNSNYQQVSTVTAVGPHIEGPAMVKLCIDQAKIKLTYSTETIIF